MEDRVYLDTCRVPRPFDDQADARVYRETAALPAIIAECERGRLTWIGSEALDFETGRARDRHILEGSKTLRAAMSQ
jgi:hypothetical protein